MLGTGFFIVSVLVYLVSLFGVIVYYVPPNPICIAGRHLTNQQPVANCQ